MLAQTTLLLPSVDVSSRSMRPPAVCAQLRCYSLFEDFALVLSCPRYFLLAEADYDVRLFHNGVISIVPELFPTTNPSRTFWHD
jgi:hypothetical protein